MELFETIYEDLTHLGGSMGTEYTTSASLGLFANVTDAKKCAEKNYYKVNKGTQKWKWIEVVKQEGTKEKDIIDWRSPDLAFVMYHVNKRMVN